VNEKTATMEKIQEQQGWTDDTLFLFALRMLEENGLTYGFEQFLQTAADDEDEENTSDEVKAVMAQVDAAIAADERPNWKRYLDEMGKTCPHCDGKDFNTGSFNSDDGYAWQRVTCSSCGCEWDDIYKLVDVDVDPEPEED
jgi:hypothetical protein